MKKYFFLLGLTISVGTILACGFKGFSLDVTDFSNVNGESVQTSASQTQVVNDYNNNAIAKVQTNIWDLITSKSDNVKFTNELKYGIVTKSDVSLAKDNKSLVFVSDGSEAKIVLNTNNLESIKGEVLALAGTESFDLEIKGIDAATGLYSPELFYSEKIDYAAEINFNIPEDVSLIEISVKSDCYASAVFQNFSIQ